MKQLIKICIERPVLALVISLVLVLFGIMGYQYLDTRFFPDFQAKKIYITTEFPGASAKLVETDLTTPLESAISEVPGIDYIESQSDRGESDITITLLDSANVDEAANKVRAAVFGALNDLPDQIQTPQIQVGWTGSELMDISFTDKNMSLAQIRDYLNRFVVNQLREVPGIGQIQLQGSDPYAMRIWLNPEKMASSQISVNEVQTALTNSNVELPVGAVKSGNINFPVTADTKLKTAKAFGQIVVKNVGGKIVYLKDIARVTLGTDDPNKEIVRVDGQYAVALIISNSQDASPITVSKALVKKLQQIKSDLPKGMTFTNVFNASFFLKDSVSEVYFALLFSILCVMFAIYIFLGSWRASLIPMATIPVCIIASFGLMNVFGFTINVITLIALVLAIGLVVDDAIVMLENIHRHMQAGLSPYKAALKGSNQIAYAVIGMTISLAAVYAPVGLMNGLTAVIFREFAFTLAGAVIISGFIALTLTPMMCSHIMNSHTLEGRYAKKLDVGFSTLQKLHQKLLRGIFKIRPLVILILIVILVGGLFVFEDMPSKFMPAEDLCFLIAVLNEPSGSNINYLENQANQISDMVKTKPYTQYYSQWLSESLGDFNHMFITLKPYAQRKQKAGAIAANLNKQINKTPGLSAFIFAPSPFSGSGHSDLSFMVTSSGSYKELYASIQTLIKKLSKYPGLTNVETNMNFDSQQYNAEVNRNLAASLNINVADIDNALSVLLGGNYTTYFDFHGYRYHVYLQANENDLKSPNDIAKYYVSNPQGKMISLDNLVTLVPTTEQAILPHYNHLRAAEVTAQLAKGYSLGKVVKYLNNNLPKMLPKNMGYDYKGAASRLEKSQHSMVLIFGLGIIFIYLVLAALFESFIDPFVVLLVVPLTIFGAISALKLLGGSLNIYTEIGLVTLIGLIAKHGILITQFANELRRDGEDIKTAVIKAASLRLRPILMTTASMIFGALPLILSGGASSNSRTQIGIVIIAGLLVGTFFSLFVVPIAYTYLSKFRRIKPKET